MTDKPGFDVSRAALPYLDERAKSGMQLADIETLGFTRDVGRAQEYYDSWRPTSHVNYVEPARPPRRNNAALKKFRRGRVTGFLLGLPVAFALVWIVVFAAQGAIARAKAEQTAAEQQTGLIGKATDYVFGTGQGQAYTGIIDWAGCEVALANGAVPISMDHPGYSPALDANHEGLACDPAAARHARTIDNSSDYAVKIHRGRGLHTVQIEVSNSYTGDLLNPALEELGEPLLSDEDHLTSGMLGRLAGAHNHTLSAVGRDDETNALFTSVSSVTNCRPPVCKNVGGVVAVWA